MSVREKFRKQPAAKPRMLDSVKVKICVKNKVDIREILGIYFGKNECFYATQQLPSSSCLRSSTVV